MIRTLRFVTAFAVSLASAGTLLASEPMPSLDRVLHEMDRVAARYRDTALRFTCNERIRHYTNDRVRTYRFRYIYVNRSGDLDDFRIPIGRTRTKAGPGWGPGSLAGFGLPSSLRRAYSWIFVFEANKREHYRFRILGEDTVFERRALKVRFEPVPPFIPNINEFYGTAWVDARTFLILRVEAIHHREYARKLEADAARADPSPRRPRLAVYESIDTEFRVERKGLRFPNEVVVRQALYRIPGDFSAKGYQIYLLKQRYRKYRFFGVETRERIDAIVEGGAESVAAAGAESASPETPVDARKQAR